MDILKIKKDRIEYLKDAVKRRKDLLASLDKTDRKLIKINKATIEYYQQELDQLILETKGN